MYGVSTLPTTIIIDPDGKVRLFHIGFIEEDKQLINEYVGQLMSTSETEPTSSTLSQ
jgi:hypothetical protein